MPPIKLEEYCVRITNYIPLILEQRKLLFPPRDAAENPYQIFMLMYAVTAFNPKPMFPFQPESVQWKIVEKIKEADKNQASVTPI